MDRNEAEDLTAGVLLFAEIARHNPRVAYIIALGFKRAAEKVANGKPLTDPNHPGTVEQVIEITADAFLAVVPGMHVKDPPAPSADKRN